MTDINELIGKISTVLERRGNSFESAESITVSNPVGMVSLLEEHGCNRSIVLTDKTIGAACAILNYFSCSASTETGGIFRKAPKEIVSKDWRIVVMNLRPTEQWKQLISICGNDTENSQLLMTLFQLKRNFIPSDELMDKDSVEAKETLGEKSIFEIDPLDFYSSLHGLMPAKESDLIHLFEHRTLPKKGLIVPLKLMVHTGSNPTIAYFRFKPNTANTADCDVLQMDDLIANSHHFAISKLHSELGEEFKVLASDLSSLFKKAIQ